MPEKRWPTYRILLIFWHKLLSRSHSRRISLLHLILRFVLRLILKLILDSILEFLPQRYHWFNLERLNLFNEILGFIIIDFFQLTILHRILFFLFYGLLNKHRCHEIRFNLFAIRLSETLMLILKFVCSKVVWMCRVAQFITTVWVYHRYYRWEHTSWLYSCIFLLFGIRRALFNMYISGFKRSLHSTHIETSLLFRTILVFILFCEVDHLPARLLRTRVAPYQVKELIWLQL
jgi:hypothetical protein